MARFVIFYFWRRLISSFNRNGFTKTLFKLPLKTLTATQILLKQGRSAQIAEFFHHHLRPLDVRTELVANYAVDSQLLKSKNLKVISAGIHDDAAFELSMSNKGASVIALDPTAITTRMFKSNKDLSSKMLYLPVALWTKDGSVKFFRSDSFEKTSEINEGSITNLNNSEDFNWVDAKCITSICSDFGWDELDYLKMDIEGAALPILEDLFSSKNQKNLWPIQFCIELELPSSEKCDEFHAILSRIKKMCRSIKDEYSLHYVAKNNEFSSIIMYGIQRNSWN